MKKKFIYIFMLVLAIVGCRLLYGINYGLDNKMMVKDNLYRYDIFGNNDAIDTLIDGKYIYYVTSLTNNYSFIKYDYTNDKTVKEYHFNNGNSLGDIKIIKENGNFYLTSEMSNKIYVFNNDLELLKTISSNQDNLVYGLYNNNIFQIDQNKIYYNNTMYDELSVTCGNIQEIIYHGSPYLRFYNYERSLGCLYNMSNKSIYYLDYDGIDIIKDDYLEYMMDSLKFRFDNQEYYFSDITENSNLKISEDADYLFTYDSTNKKLRIYNLETRKIIYEKKLDFSDNSYVSNVKLSNYAYFTVFENNKNYLYIWDYLKDSRTNYDMYTNNDKEYKFKNDRLIQDLDDKYHVNVYMYDEAVKYFKEIYVIPSYDNILINTKLNELDSVLSDIKIDTNNKKINIYLVKNIVMGDSNERLLATTIIDNNKFDIVVNITDDNFKDNLLNELRKIM